MKSYLDLVPISAKYHKRQSRMTRICIVLAVFLVASIFGMADMEIRAQRYQSIKEDGAWHVIFREITDEQAELIAARPEVKMTSRYAVTNYGINMGYTINGKETAVCGFDENMLKLYPSMEIVEGEFPSQDGQAVAAESIKKQLGVQIGEQLTMETPDGPINFTVSGFTGDTSMLASQDAFGLFLNTDTYRKHFSKSTSAVDTAVYVQFTPFCSMQKVIRDICSQLGIPADRIGQNTKLMALMLQSTDPYLMQFYVIAVILAILVMTAGILMISGSLSSNIAQRTQFFGMISCLGAAKKQIIRFVRREALNWCKTSIPLGLGASILVVWGLCAMLKFLSPVYFDGMPAFEVSWIGLAAGVLVGLVTVLLAVRTPARHAARVSPLTAVSGNAGTMAAVRRAANTRMFKIDTALGVHHAVGNKKNFLLMTGSFAFSIILFLSFSPMIDFMQHAINPLRPSAPDLSMECQDDASSIPVSLADEISKKPYVKRVYGRSFAYSIPALAGGKDTEVNLVSYETNQFEWAEDSVLEGDLDAARQGLGVLAEMGGDIIFHPGDLITLELGSGNKEVSIAGVLSYTPFSRAAGAENIVCSESLFRELTGEDGYAVLDIQLDRDASEADVDELRSLAGERMVFSDKRMSNSGARGAYYSFAIFVYGFLVVIALISAFNIINSIAMSVSARMKQYGAMRAIGMSSRQLRRMVSAEAVTYAVCGIILGTLAGLATNRQLFLWLVSARWGDPWYLPLRAMAVIILAVLISVIWAVREPSKRIRDMSIVDTISAK